jgi:murein DD-endopeptidase MepM/ murein hydrolase activator NlpD
LKVRLIALGVAFVAVGPISTGYAGDCPHLHPVDRSMVLSMRMPLDVIRVSSGFGLRLDPFDQPPSGTRLVQPALVEGIRRRDIATGANGKDAKANIVIRTRVTLVPRPQQKLAIRAQRSAKAPSKGPFMALGVVTNGARANASAQSGIRGQSRQPALPFQGPAKTMFMHEGVDLAAPTGTPIFAASDGTVISSESNGGYGNWIHIEHSENFSTVYGHLSAFVSGIGPGVQVKKGQLIGFVGSTGHSTGPHLHFEIVSNGQPVDPLSFPGISSPQAGAQSVNELDCRIGRKPLY